MKIKNNCRKATFLVEKKMLGRLTFPEKMELKIHLSGCADCRLYRQQSRFIQELFIALFQHVNTQEARLDESFKIKLEKIIDIRIKSAGD